MLRIPELAHLVRNVRRATRPGSHEGVHRQVPRGFPVFSCRGGRYRPAVTAGVQPMLPAAGLPIRLRPGLSRRPSSAGAAARPGPPAGHRTRWARLPWRSRAPSAAAGGAGATHADDHLRYQGNKAEPAEEPRDPAGCECFRPGGSRGRCARLAHQVNLLPEVLLHLGRGRRFRAKAPRNQPEAGSACPLCQGPLRRPAAQCPAPAAAWVTTGATKGTHPGVREGLAPSRCIKATHRNWAMLSSRAIPALSPRRRVCAKLPGCRHPDVAARQGQGGADAQVRPHPR